MTAAITVPLPTINLAAPCITRTRADFAQLLLNGDPGLQYLEPRVSYSRSGKALQGNESKTAAFFTDVLHRALRGSRSVRKPDLLKTSGAYRSRLAAA
jgi:hypothetical protein